MTGNRVAKIAVILAGLIGLYALLGFVVVPYYLKTTLPPTLSARLAHPAAVEDVQFNPFTLELIIRGFHITEADHTRLVGFDELVVNLALSSLFNRAWTFDQIRMRIPYARVVIDSDGRLNLRTLKQPPAPPSPSTDSADREASGSTIPPVIIQSLEIENGAVEFHDQSRATPYADTVHLWFALQNFGSRQARDNTFAFRAQLHEGEDLTWQGRLFLDPLHSEGQVTLTGIQLHQVWEYVRDTVNWELREGTLHAETSYILGTTPQGLQVTTMDGGVRVEQLTVVEKDGKQPLIALPVFALRGVGWDLAKQRVEIGSVESQGASIQGVIEKNGRINLQRLFAPTTPVQGPTGTAQAVSPTPAASPSLTARLGKVVLDDYRVMIEDQRLPNPRRLTVSGLHLDLEHAAYPGTTPTRVGASLLVNNTATLAIHGDMTLDPLRSEGQMTLSGVRLRQVWEYVRDTVNWELHEGTLHAETSFALEATPQGLQVRTKGGAVRLEQLAIVEKGGKEKLIVLPAFTMRGIGFELAKHRVTLGTVTSRGASAHVVIEKDGRPNLQRLFASVTPEQNPSGAVQAASSSDAASSPWRAVLGKLLIEDNRVMIEDQRLPEPVWFTLSHIHLDVEHATYPGTTPARVGASLLINDTGTLGIGGDVTMTPLAADVKLMASQLPVASLQPYLAEMAHIEIKSGAANAAGQVHYAVEQTPSLRFQGDASVTDFKTVDAHLKKDFVTCEALAASQIDVRLPAGGITISEILARRPYVDLIIAEDRTINLKTVTNPREENVGSRAAADEQSAAPNQSAATRINAVRIVDGSAHFADFSIHPQVDTGIYHLNGSVLDLSSENVAPAKVDLHGEVDEYAPVTIAGTINPLSSSASTDLRVSFKNVNLPILSPYSTKFAGYVIEKGKLSVELDYRLAGQHLEAENDVVIDQLTLGQKIDSPEATSLPVKLVVALLKDEHGRINVSLPVRGDLNDPDFHYGQLLWNTAVNLFQKAVASPFAWLGNLARGGAEELSQIPFRVGSAELPSDGEQKLNSLAKSLEERPGLQLEVTGSADPIADRVALREVKLQQELASVKQVQTPAESPQTSEARTDDEAIHALYIRRFGELPQHDPHASVNTEELRARLLETITVDDNDLRRLAQQRAAQVQNFLVNRTAVPAERVYVLEAKTDGHAESDSVETKLDLTAS